MKAKSKLKTMRENKGVTLAEVATHARIGISRYFMIESGERPASPGIAKLISDYFSVSVEEFFSPNSFTVREVGGAAGKNEKPTGTTG